MDRRSLLAGASVALLPSFGGCVRNLIGSGTTDAESTDEDEDDLYSRENICHEPPDDVTPLEYESRAMIAPGSAPLVEGGYWGEATDRDEADRLHLVTAESADRLRLDPVYEDETNYDDEDRAFFDELDLETSVLLAFDTAFDGDQQFTVQAVDHEDETTIHAYACRFGDPSPPQYSDQSHGEPPGAPITLFVRVAVDPAPARAELTYRRLPKYEEVLETETYTTETEGSSMNAIRPSARPASTKPVRPSAR